MKACIGYTKQSFNILLYKMKVLSISDEDEQRSHLKVLPSLWKMPVLNLKNNQKLSEDFMQENNMLKILFKTLYQLWKSGKLF